MRRTARLEAVFVEDVPEQLRDGKLYVSMRYATALHRCCCGCGCEVVTPLAPTDWRLVFDGETVSLEPSIGNWSFPCRSHYWITNGRVQWAPAWSQTRVDANRLMDGAAKESFQRMRAADERDRGSREPAGESWLYRLRRWLSPAGRAPGRPAAAGDQNN